MTAFVTSGQQSDRSRGSGHLRAIEATAPRTVYETDRTLWTGRGVPDVVRGEKTIAHRPLNCDVRESRSRLPDTMDLEHRASVVAGEKY